MMSAEATATGRRCLFITPIGKENSPERDRADQILQYILRPVLEPSGYRVDRADLVAGTGMIDTEVIDRLANDDLVIADLTGQNPNVFYEIAIRHGFQNPIVQIIDGTGNEKIPFYLRQIKTINYDISSPKGIEQFKSRLGDYAKAAMEGESGYANPVSFFFAIQQARQGGTNVEDNLAGILKILEGMLNQVGHLSDSMLVATAPKSLLFRLKEIEEFVKQVARMMGPSTWNDHDTAILRDALNGAADELGFSIAKLATPSVDAGGGFALYNASLKLSDVGSEITSETDLSQQSSSSE